MSSIKLWSSVFLTLNATSISSINFLAAISLSWFSRFSINQFLLGPENLRRYARNLSIDVFFLLIVLMQVMAWMKLSLITSILNAIDKKQYKLKESARTFNIEENETNSFINWKYNTKNRLCIVYSKIIATSDHCLRKMFEKNSSFHVK